MGQCKKVPRKVLALGVIFLATTALASDFGSALPSLLPAGYSNVETGHSLQPLRTVSGSNTETQQFRHFYRGIEVLGDVVSLQRNGTGKDQWIMSGPTFDLDSVPNVSTEEAQRIAMIPDSQPVLKILRHGSSRTPRLIYWVSPRPSDSLQAHFKIIDAQSGRLIASLPRIMTTDIEESHPAVLTQDPPSKPLHVPGGKLQQATQEVYDGRKISPRDIDFSSGTPMMIRLNELPKMVSNGVANLTIDQAGLEAFSAMEKVSKYYRDIQARNSFDGKGFAIRSVVHGGIRYSNAFWSSEYRAMVFGDGDGKRYSSFTKALDIAGHEFTHGVVSHAVGPFIVPGLEEPIYGLVYMGESGALNEAFADFFGKMIDNKNDWIIGKEIFVNPSEHGRGIRNLIEPGVRRIAYYDKDDNRVEAGYPKTYFEKIPEPEDCGPYNDYCWVHVNSTIIGHFGYRLVQLIGKPSAEGLMYATLNHYLTPLARFSDFRDGLLKACKTRESSATCQSIHGLFEELGFFSATVPG